MQPESVPLCLFVPVTVPSALLRGDRHQSCITAFILRLAVDIRDYIRQQSFSRSTNSDYQVIIMVSSLIHRQVTAKNSSWAFYSAGNFTAGQQIAQREESPPSRALGARHFLTGAPAARWRREPALHAPTLHAPLSLQIYLTVKSWVLSTTSEPVVVLFLQPSSRPPTIKSCFTSLKSPLLEYCFITHKQYHSLFALLLCVMR